MIPILLEPINLQIKDTQVAFGDAVMEHNMQCQHCKENLDSFKIVRQGGMLAIAVSDSQIEMNITKRIRYVTGDEYIHLCLCEIVYFHFTS